MGNSVQKEVNRGHSDWLINKGTHREPIRLEQLTGQTSSETQGQDYRARGRYNGGFGWRESLL